MVDVAEQHADACSRRLRLPQRGLKSPDGLRPVRQPGEGVEPGQLLEPLLGLDLLIDDAQRRNQPIGAALRIDIRLSVTVDPVVTVVGGADPEPLPDRVAGGDPLDGRCQCEAVIGVDVAAEA